MSSKRIDQILDRVNQAGKIEVNQLAKELNVSQVTIRKDLTTLEDKGLLRRQRGIAIINDPANLRFRLGQHYEAKQAIAAAAADQVENQSTIMIESGSNCALLAENLGKQGKQITIITISSFIADYISSYTNLNVILLGGNYQPNSQVSVGPLTKQMLKNFQVNQLFVGTDGFSAQTGFYGNDILRSEIVQAMTRQAKEVTILTDSSKFEHTSLVPLLNFSDIKQVITDQGISQENRLAMERAGVIVTTV